MTLFGLEDVSLARGGVQVLEGVEAELPAGSSCIWGRSGAGKSSLLRLLNRLADPDRGRVLFRGRDVRELDPLALRRRAVYVPQVPAPIPGSVADNVSYGARLLGAEVDVAALLEHVDLPRGLADRAAERLSIGQQQRVALARALALEPEALLLDEPTSALDERSRDAVEATLAHLRDDLGVSLVVVTHDLGQARRLAQWVLELEHGRVRSQGSAVELLGA